MSVMGIILAFAALNARPMFARQQVNGRVNDLISSFNLARSEAATRGRRVVVCASADGETCSNINSWGDGWLVFTDTNNDGEVNADSDLIRVFNVSMRGVFVIGAMTDSSGAAVDSSRVYFDESGFLNASRLSRALLAVANGEKTTEVEIIGTGRVRSR